MDEETLKNTIAKNIAFYRKLNGHTQAELAACIRYSDKSVSKWERAEGVPDVYVLTLIAKLYGVTVGDLLSEEPPMPQSGPKKLLITLLSMGLVWLVASVVFFALEVTCPGLPKVWMTFIYAMPVSFIVLVVFAALWSGHLYQCLSVSGLVWSIALCVHLMTVQYETKVIYIVAAVFQVLTILWFLLKSRK